MKPFESFLAPRLEEFVAYRYNLGYSKKALASHLKMFDRYLVEQKARSDSLTPSFFLKLRANLKKQPSTLNKIFQAARGFFNFMIRQELWDENPLADIAALKKKEFLPFVFSPQQVDQLLAAVCKKIRKSHRYFLKDYGVYLAMVLLARCGLRISEPLRRLRLKNYRPKEKTIYIEKTKFKKDRLIPVPKAVAEQIDNYLAAKNALLYDDQTPHLIAGVKQNPLNEQRIRYVFHQAVKDIGLDQCIDPIPNTTFGPPVVHSLRHSFAINTLKAVKLRGQSAQYALPILAEYMGHSQYIYTAKYLKVLDADHRQNLMHFTTLHHDDS